MNRSLVWLVLWLVGSLARVSAADVDVVIPAGDGTFTTNIVFTTAELGATKTVGVTPAKDYHFKSQPTVNHDSTVIMVQQVSYSECGAEYKIWLVGNHKQGTVQISGTISPGGCSSGSGGGGGGRGGGTSTPPSDRGFEINVLQRQTVIHFTQPGNGTNLTASVGSTNNLAVRVVLGDATAPASGTVTFSRSPSDLGTLDPSSVALNAGVASTTFIAASNGGAGTITATTTALKDGLGNTLPNVSTNLTVNNLKVDIVTDINDDGIIDAADDSIEEAGIGEIVRVNDNNDPSSGEDDLQYMKVKIEPALTSGVVWFTYETNKVAIWKDLARTQPIVSGSETAPAWNLSTDVVPDHVYVEGLAATASNASINVSIHLKANGTECTDTILLSAVD